MIKVKGVTKYYGPVKAVENVTFTINKGEIAGFLGPNGAGKSTILRIITGVLAPTSGTVEVFGHDVIKDPVEARKKIGYLSENNPLYPDYSPREYLSFIAQVRGVGRVKARVDEVMERVFITDMADRRIQRLSRGYRQRVGLAAAMIGQPEVLLLDEPTVGLDPAQIVEIRELIRSIGRTNTIFLSTHILQEVTQLCNRVVIINQGRIAAVDTQEGLAARASDAGSRQVALLVRNPGERLSEVLLTVQGVRTVASDPPEDGLVRFLVSTEAEKDLRPALAAAAVGAGAELCELQSVHSSLEEIFVKLTSDEGGTR